MAQSTLRGGNLVLNLQKSAQAVSDNMGINLQKPKFPQYAVMEKRVESFKKWPKYLPMSPKILAEAGLVYTGTGDSVRCYSCGGGLRNWEEGDSAWVEHAKWYPNCAHVQLNKGNDFINGVREGQIISDIEYPNQSDTQAVNHSKQPTQNDPLNSIAAQSCIENGFKQELVKKAIELFIAEHGHTDFQGIDLAKILMDLEESEVVPKTDEEPSPSSTPEVSSENNVATSEPVKQEVEEESEPEDPEKTAQLLQENERLKDLKLCKICLDAPSSIIFLPCGHMVSCPQCAPALVKCPICRLQIKGNVRAFFA